MINGSLETLNDYRGLNPDFASTIDYLLSHDLNALPEGKTVVNDKVTITKLRYFGKEEGKAFPEEHRHHLDLQILLQGRENCYFDYLEEEFENHVQTPYNEEKDVVKYDVPLRHKLVMDTGNFTMFTPDDVHLPSLKIDDCEIIKLVIKIAL